MEGTEGNVEKFDLSLRVNGLLLQKYTKHRRYANENEQDEGEGDEKEEDIELSLGLSMNGRFGVDPARKKLKRSSSIANLVFTVGTGENGRSQQARVAEFDTYAPLVRTRSLPAETGEEEWRRRKEVQYMRRMEARKKRMEKLKYARVMRDKENGFEDVNLNKIVDNGNVMVSSQGSVGSSGSSDLLSPPQVEGAKENGEEVVEQERGVNGANEMLKKAIVEMPYVTTKGDGEKIEGFLYRYKKGEEVRIVCVCHGTFLTPAEFVKHGGGGDVEHPLKHIVVNPFPLL